MMKARVHVFIEGDVQGVNFRYYTWQKAKQFNVFGWIKNLRDGRVEAVFEGEEDAVEELLDFCRQGPSAATVSDVVVKREDWRGEFKDFKIIY